MLFLICAFLFTPSFFYEHNQGVKNKDLVYMAHDVGMPAIWDVA
jgi:hypothetical protein